MATPERPGEDGETRGEGIAVVGLSARFPGAPDLATFWQRLRDGVDALEELDDDDLIAAGVSAEDRADPTWVRAARVLEGVDEFDAGFFGYTPREAELLDPQHRLFLQAAWAALEHAGHTSSSAGSVGVFAGLGMNTYLLANLVPRHGARLPLEDLTAQLASDKDFLATRVSYHLDLSGPSFAVQCGCSASLAAVAQAFTALSTYQCDLALAGGVSVRLPQRAGHPFVPESILSPDGRCRPFDARARGTSFGSGVGVVALARLEDALERGDRIHAVLRGIAVNNDGGQKLGYTAPSVERQAEVIALAQALAGVEPRSIGYVEAHGTGTELGDPVEVAALSQVFRAGGVEPGACLLGSVKGNVGHLEAASGMAGLIKTVLALEHGELPPTAHFETPNPKIELERTPFRVNAELVEWPASDGPRRAGVSSFGIGGTNVHAILEEAPTREEARESARERQVLVLSAKTDAALERSREQLASHLETSREPLADVAHTLQVGRTALERRAAIVATSTTGAAEALRDAPSSRAVHRSVAFLFPGQGAQHARMAAGLASDEPVFRAELDACCGILDPLLGLDLRAAMFEGDGADLARTSLAQPALFAVELALARLWQSRGVRPDALLGHSVGELVAACVAGVFERDEALALVAARGRLIEELPGGAMLAVPLPPAEVRARLTPELSLAAVNAAELCTVSGPTDAITAFENRLVDEEYWGRPLEVSHAFHSALVEPALDAFRAEVERTRRSAPTIPFVSNVTGTWITAEQATDPDYWVRHMRETVQFHAGLRTLLAEPTRCLLEVGPGTTLRDLAGVSVSGDQVALASMRHPRDDREDGAVLLETVGALWCAGVELDWEALHTGERRRRVPLPTYPFERERHWIEPPREEERPTPVQTTDDPGQWFWLRRWVPADTAQTAPTRPTRWLVVASVTGESQRLVDRLRDAGHEVAVHALERLDSVDPDGFDRVLMVDLATSEPLGTEAALDAGFRALHRVVEHASDVTVLTRGAADTDGGAACPVRATVLGAARVLPQERAGLTVRVVDVDDLARSHDALVAELERPEPLVALRDGRRLVPKLERADLGPATDLAGFRRGGTYLITGGLGGVGRTLACHLAGELGANLVLCGRSDVGADELRGTIESLGGRALFVRADVARVEDVERLFTVAREAFGPVHGVIHAAGVAGRGMQDGASELALSAKLTGTENLFELGGEELELLVLCSAVSTVLGGLGQADYCAANAFLDAFATTVAGAAPPRVLSIGWDTWSEVGMAVEAEVPEALRARRDEILAAGLSNAEGIEVFRRALAAPHAHVLVSRTPLPERVAETAAPFASTGASTGTSTNRSSGTVASEVAVLWNQLLGIDHSEPEDNFFELGGNSLLATQMLGRLRRQFEGAELSLREMFAEPTLSGLIGTIERAVSGAPAGPRQERPDQVPAPASPDVAVAVAVSVGGLRAKLDALTAKDERRALLADYLADCIAEVVDASAEELAADGDLSGFDATLLAAHVTDALSHDLDLPLYPHEVRGAVSIAELAAAVEGEVRTDDAAHPAARGGSRGAGRRASGSRRPEEFRRGFRPLGAALGLHAPPRDALGAPRAALSARALPPRPRADARLARGPVPLVLRRRTDARPGRRARARVRRRGEPGRRARRARRAGARGVRAPAGERSDAGRQDADLRALARRAGPRRALVRRAALRVPRAASLRDDRVDRPQPARPRARHPGRSVGRGRGRLGADLPEPRAALVVLRSARSPGPLRGPGHGPRGRARCALCAPRRRLRRGRARSLRQGAHARRPRRPAPLPARARRPEPGRRLEEGRAPARRRRGLRRARRGLRLRAALVPFVVVPRSRALTDAELARLGERLCPYTEVPTRILETEHHAVWATSLASRERERVRNTLVGGTASFELRVEGGALVVATDRLGTCPIWFADGLVSPEAKALAVLRPVELRSEEELLAQGRRPAGWSPYVNVERLPQGAALRLRDDGVETFGEPVRFDVPRSAPEARDWPAVLGEALVRAYEPNDAATGAFVSGGIDSSIACALARRHGPVRTFSLGTVHGDEFDEARSLADALGTEHAELQLAADQVPAELERVVFQNEVFCGLTAEIVLQLSVLYGAAADGCRRIVTGYGSDLLFDGMLRHEAYMAAVALETTADLIERTRWTAELAPFVHWSRGLAVEYVFWDEDLMRVALEVPSELCYRDGVEKHVLREAAVRAGLLTEPLAFRAKRGMTDGTAANRLVSEVLGIEDVYGYGGEGAAEHRLAASDDRGPVLTLSPRRSPECSPAPAPRRRTPRGRAAPGSCPSGSGRPPASRGSRRTRGRRRPSAGTPAPRPTWPRPHPPRAPASWAAHRAHGVGPCAASARSPAWP